MSSHSGRHWNDWNWIGVAVSLKGPTFQVAEILRWPNLSTKFRDRYPPSKICYCIYHIKNIYKENSTYTLSRVNKIKGFFSLLQWWGPNLTSSPAPAGYANRSPLSPQIWPLWGLPEARFTSKVCRGMDPKKSDSDLCNFVQVVDVWQQTNWEVLPGLVNIQKTMENHHFQLINPL